MKQINVKRLLLGGLCAGALIWLVEGAASVLYMQTMEAAMKAHNLSMAMTPATWMISVLVSLLVGLALVFFYAAARPRFGPGPKTALVVAFVLWLSGCVVSLLGYGMLGLFPGSMLLQWAVTGLVEMMLAALLGGWLYREGQSGGA